MDGSPVTVPITVPGQQGRLTFTGVAGSKVSARASNAGWICSTLAIYKPDNTVLANPVAYGTGVFLEPVVLPVNGVYTLVLDPWNESVPTMTAQAWLVNNFNGAIDVGGASPERDHQIGDARVAVRLDRVQSSTSTAM